MDKDTIARWMRMLEHSKYLLKHPPEDNLESEDVCDAEEVQTVVDEMRVAWVDAVRLEARSA